jgi:hypothetical protein
LAQIPPWTILAGLGSLKRRELCDLLAVFEDASLLNIVSDRVRDITRRRAVTEGVEDDAAFRQRLKTTSGRTCRSHHSDAVLRLRLWHAMGTAFDLEAAIPLSTRRANLRAADVAQSAADALRDTITANTEEKSWTDIPDRLWSHMEDLFSRDRADFSTVVGAQASRTVAEAAEAGTLDDAAKAELVEKIRQQLDRLSPELRDQSVEQALKTGDVAALALLTSGTSLVSIGVAVELAGFSAYIMAAQASAFIPLLGGKAVVSGLFVLAHPLFIIPMILGGGYLARDYLQRSVRTKLASSLAVQMALKGLSAGNIGLQMCLNDFKSLTALDIAGAAISDAQSYRGRFDLIHDLVGNPLPATPGRPEESLDRVPTGKAVDDLEQVLFPGQRGVAGEAIAVAGMTLADIVYDATAIDPSVIAAADFSRSADLAGIFKFGGFADRVRDLSGAALAGTESNLRGYVAEQIVAARLVEQGYQVSLPETANNPGFDMLVDGDPFQVKCLRDLNGLAKHFEKYPDMPALVNGELATKIEESGYDWIDKVFFVEGYDYETTKQVMDVALDAGAALDDLDVPVFAVAVSAAKNIHAWWKGSLPLEDLPFEVAVDGAVKGGLAAAGGFAGSTLGLLVFGPAGAVVFSGVGGAGALFGSGWARQKLDRALIGEWLAQVDATSERFRAALKTAMQQKIEILLQKAHHLDALDSEHVPWLKLRLIDNALAIAECAADLEIEAVKRDQPGRAAAYLRLMREASVHPWSVNSELTDLMTSFARKPGLTDIGRDYFDNAVGHLDLPIF